MSWTILRGDALHIPLADESVQCVVTSPPYWGLRVYQGVEPSVWGGDPDCDHVWDTTSHRPQQHGDDGHTGNLEGRTATQAATRIGPVESATCIRCGAWWGCLGLEPAPDLYVAHIVDVFREVWRVLHPMGTLWLNLGSSYVSRQIESDEMVMRDDLTPEERRYVLGELAKHV